MALEAAPMWIVWTTLFYLLMIYPIGAALMFTVCYWSPFRWRFARCIPPACNRHTSLYAAKMGILWLPFLAYVAYPHLERRFLRRRLSE
jgi:hypothetical protein